MYFFSGWNSFSQIDELRTTIAKKDQKIMDCREAIDRLQASVQRFTGGLEKCQNKAELRSSSLAYKFTNFIGTQEISSVTKSEPFYSPPIPYRFQIIIKMQREELFKSVHIFCGANDPHKEISLEVYVINECGYKVSAEKKSIDLHSQTGNNKTKGKKWVMDNNLQLFCKINQVISLKCEGF